MIIQNHDIQMDSSRVLVQHHEKNEELHVWDNNFRMDFSRQEEQSKIKLETFDLLDISREGMAKFKEAANKKIPMQTLLDNQALEDEDMNLSPKYMIAKMILERFFGIKVEIVEAGEENNKSENSQEQQAQPTGQNQAAPQAQQPQGWGLSYSYHELNYEKESVKFSAEGKVTTADGREINFAAQLEMSKETLQELSVEYKLGDALIDPLALNLDGQGVRLSGEKFQFDLDANGQAENISFLEKGSAFLVLDKNQNGTVDDGSELFGPTTNNGFKELKAYDSDQNDWIDENDAIFFQLSLWTKNDDGSDTLSTLKDYDVGAIYLNSARTSFDLEEGQLRETGVYLKEDGQVNFIQEVDLQTSNNTSQVA